jgi:prevent-host-death family protein
MREIGAFEAKSKLGTLLDWVEGGEEVLITRRGKAVARLVPAAIGFDRARAAEAAQRIRERAEKLQGSFSWAEWKAMRDEGRA